MEPKPHTLDILETYKTLQQVVAEVKFVPMSAPPPEELTSKCMWESLVKLEKVAAHHKLDPLLPEDTKDINSGLLVTGILNKVIDFLRLLIIRSKDSEIIRESIAEFEYLEQDPSNSFKFCLELKDLGIPIPSTTSTSTSTRLNWIAIIRPVPQVSSDNSFVLSFKKNSNASIADFGITRTASKSFIQGSMAQSTADHISTTFHKFKHQPSIGFTSPKLTVHKPKISSPLSPNLNHEEQNLRFNTISPFRIRQNFARAGESENADKIKLKTLDASNSTRNCCLLLQKAQFDKWSVRELSNLFTNYGNIERVVYSTNARTCLFVYCSQTGVLNAINCLSGMGSQNLELDLLPNPSDELLEISFPKHEIAEFIPRKRFVSSETGLPNIVNPVSKTLHVTFYSEETKSSLSDLQLIQVFSQIVPPVRLKRESGRRKKNMWFVEFETSEQALKVLMQFHNREVSGGAIRLSFTKNLA